MNKEEILKRNVEEVSKCEVKYNITEKGILNAMQEYSDQQSLSKDKEIEELKKEKKETFDGWTQSLALHKEREVMFNKELNSIRSAEKSLIEITIELKAKLEVAIKSFNAIEKWERENKRLYVVHTICTETIKTLNEK